MDVLTTDMASALKDFRQEAREKTTPSFAARIRREESEAANDTSATTSANTNNSTYSDVRTVGGDAAKPVVGDWTEMLAAQQALAKALAGPEMETEQERMPESFVALALAARRRREKGIGGMALGRA